MSKIGADIAQLSSLSSSFKAQSGQVQTLISTINRQLGNTWWVGPAFDKFQGDWQNRFVPTLNSLSQALEVAGNDVEKRRAAIEAAGS